MDYQRYLAINRQTDILKDTKRQIIYIKKDTKGQIIDIKRDTKRQIDRYSER